VKPSTLRKLTVLDIVGVALFVPLFIWRLQFAFPSSWAAFPVWLLVSFLVHRDTPQTLGWRADNLWPATKQAVAVFAGLAAALMISGSILGTLQGFPLSLMSARRLGLYFAFCLLQQVALQSFLNNRAMSLIPRRWGSSILTGGIFAIAHWPNPVLVPTTLVGGTLLAWLFARHRNVLPLAVGQALLGSLVWICFPVEWHHRMRVGPGYYRPF